MKIKSKRKQLNMSQIELAKGICTQGTISNIENGNSMPSTYILKEIAIKLDIDIFEITIGNQSSTQRVLSNVSKLVALGKHENAYYQLVGQINSSEIINISQSKRYYYYLGMTTLVGLVDVDKAEKIFNRILEDYEINGDVEDILVYCGLGIISCERKKIKKAQKWFDKAVLMLRNETLFREENIFEILKIYFNIAKFYSEIKEYEISIQMADEGIFWANELNNSYHLGYLIYEKGFNLLALGQKKNAEINYNMALVYAITSKHEVLKETIINDSKQLGINLFMSKAEINNY